MTASSVLLITALAFAGGQFELSWDRGSQVDGRIHGVVVDECGAPVAGATVFAESVRVLGGYDAGGWVCGQLGEPTWQVETRTNRLGRYTLELPETTLGSLGARAPGHLSEWLWKQPEIDAARIELCRSYTVDVEVCDERGGPVEMPMPRVRSVDGRTGFAVQRIGRGRLRLEGLPDTVLEFEFTAGGRRLIAHHDSRLPWLSLMAPPDSELDVELELAPRLDPAELWVQLYDAAATGPVETRWCRNLASSQLSFPHLSPGTWTVALERPCLDECGNVQSWDRLASAQVELEAGGVASTLLTAP